MALKALNCPNCGGTYNPTKYRCEYCGSYIIMSNDNYLDLSKINFGVKKQENDDYPGTYVFGRLLGKGEKPITIGVANYFTGATSAGGKLLLTNRSLSFSAHALNVGREEAKIKLDSITDVKLGANFLISQHIIISTSTGTHRFVVFHGKEWVERIKEAIKNKTDYQDDTSLASPDYTIELRKLQSLLKDGIITQEEFDIKKRIVLGI